jgi:ATP-dependent DNA helicase RecG
LTHSHDLQALLDAGLGPELHWFPEDVPLERLAGVLVGMANGSGGVILLGVSPRAGRIQGLSNPQHMVDYIFQAEVLVDPPLVLPLPQLRHTEAGVVVLVQVPAGLPHVYSLEGRYLGREGAQTNPLPARRLRQLLVERGAVQFEALPVPGATLDDLDLEKAAAYVTALGFSRGEPVEQILLQRGCLNREEGANGKAILRPNYAGLLLFGRHPQRWLPNATILAARFSGATFADRYLKQDIGGTLVEQLHQVEAFFRQNLPSVVRLVGLAHEETLEYPPEAVRELLVNAVAHRDYNLQGDNIHLNIFADRLEVHSPGGLPGPVTLDNLLEARFSRNAVIVQVLADLGFVERLGYGLDRVVRSVRKAGLRQPKFEELGGTFRVTLYGESLSPSSAQLKQVEAYRHLELNTRQEQALAYLIQNRRITSRDYQELSPEVHPETLRRDLVDLVERGVLIKVGDKRATYYILK